VRVLVTGGAGFIGSHLVDALVARGDDVRVLDDLSTGRAANVPAEAEMLVGSITDQRLVRRAVSDIEIVFHQAALGSVQRSVKDPLATHAANVTGTLSLLRAAADSEVERLVFASSSSVYGGTGGLPTPESAVPTPRSPYAVSKLASEHYCRVFTELDELETVSLRYFNVYGPRQRGDSEYAAVIPRFVSALREARDPTIFGDGLQSRDFTFVGDVVRANLLASTGSSASAGQAYNVGAGQSQSVLRVLEVLCSLLGANARPKFEDARAGDVQQSLADGSAAWRDLGFSCEVPFEDGLRRTVI
jgi:UDP-glucose 4-epimerase